MAFDIKAFMAARFEPRTESVAVPGLDAWFIDEDPVWIVRGQTANEIAKANNAAEKHKAIDSIVKAIAAESDKVAAIKAQLGIDGNTPGEVIKRLEQLVMCSVEPVITLDIAVKLAESRPVEFYILTNKIVELTAMGMDVKKSRGSGARQDSGAA